MTSKAAATEALSAIMAAREALRQALTLPCVEHRQHPPTHGRGAHHPHTSHVTTHRTLQVGRTSLSLGMDEQGGREERVVVGLELGFGEPLSFIARRSSAPGSRVEGFTGSRVTVPLAAAARLVDAEGRLSPMEAHERHQS